MDALGSCWVSCLGAVSTLLDGVPHDQYNLAFVAPELGVPCLGVAGAAFDVDDHSFDLPSFVVIQNRLPVVASSSCIAGAWAVLFEALLTFWR